MTAALTLVDRGIGVHLVMRSELGRQVDFPCFDELACALNFNRDGDSFEAHAKESAEFAGLLVNQDDMLRLCQSAPEFLNILVRLGVIFDRDVEGYLRFSKGGTDYCRQLTSIHGLTAQITRVFSQLLTKHIKSGQIRYFGRHEFLSLIQNEQGQAVGCVVQDLRTMKMHALKAQTVILSGDDCSVLWRNAESSRWQDLGSMMLPAWQDGCQLANLEFLNVWPLSLTHPNANMAIDPHVFKDVVSVHWPMSSARVRMDQSQFDPQVLLRSMVQHQPKASLNSPWCLEFQNVDLTGFKEHERVGLLSKCVRNDQNELVLTDVRPLVVSSLGGFHVDQNFKTTIEGVYAVGNSSTRLVGSGCLRGNELLVSWYSARRAVDEILTSQVSKTEYEIASEKFYDRAVQKQLAYEQELMDLSGPENLHQLRDELIEVMRSDVGLVRSNVVLQKAEEQVQSLKERFYRVSVRDQSRCYNQELMLARGLCLSLDLARAVIISALCRNESRGCHYKSENSYLDDQNYRRVSVVEYQAKQRPQISYADVNDVCLAQTALWALQKTAV